MIANKNIILLILSLNIYVNSDGQLINKEKTGIAVGAGYNGSIAQAGQDIRMYVPLRKRIHFVPEYYHYGLSATWNKEKDYYLINEFYLNLNLHYKLLSYKKLDLYLVAGYVYTVWINEDSITGAGRYHGIDGGIGVEYHFRHLTVFSEHRTNSVWAEYNTFLGIRNIHFLSGLFRKKPKKRYDLPES